MDFLGGIFILIFLVIIIYPNFVFYKGLKSIEKNHFKHKLFYFLISLVVSCSIVILVAIVAASQVLDEMWDFNTALDDYISRIIFACIIFPPGIFINIYLAKFYLKRISNKKIEIELIGKE